MYIYILQYYTEAMSKAAAIKALPAPLTRATTPLLCPLVYSPSALQKFIPRRKKNQEVAECSNLKVSQKGAYNDDKDKISKFQQLADC